MYPPLIKFHSLFVTFPPCIVLCFLCDVLQFNLGSLLKVVEGSGRFGKAFNFVLTRIFILVYTVAGIAFWREVWYLFDLMLLSVKRFDGPDKKMQVTFYCISFLVSFSFYSVCSFESEKLFQGLFRYRTKYKFLKRIVKDGFEDLRKQHSLKMPLVFIP